MYVKTGSNPTNYVASKLFAKIIFLKKIKGFLDISVRTGYFSAYQRIVHYLFIYLFMSSLDLRIKTEMVLIYGLGCRCYPVTLLPCYCSFVLIFLKPWGSTTNRTFSLELIIFVFYCFFLRVSPWRSTMKRTLNKKVSRFFCFIVRISHYVAENYYFGS